MAAKRFVQVACKGNDHVVYMRGLTITFANSSL